MIRKLFLALPVLLLPQFVSAQTIVSDPQLEATTQTNQVLLSQILQQVTEIHSLLQNGQASVSPAQRAVINAEMAKAFAVAHATGQIPASDVLPGNPAAANTAVAATSK